jgi:hypothetical protein
MSKPVLWRKCSTSNNSLYCSFYYLFDTIHFFFLLKEKTPMTNIPNNPKTTGKVLSPKFPISKTAAITIKIIPINSAIFWNIILHMLISPRTLYRLSLERLSLYTDRFARHILPRTSNYLPQIFLMIFRKNLVFP